MFKSIIEWLKNNQKNAPIDVQGWRPEGERPTPESLVKTRKFHRVACGYQPVPSKDSTEQRFNPNLSGSYKTIGTLMDYPEDRDNLFGIFEIKDGYYIEFRGDIWRVACPSIFKLPKSENDPLDIACHMKIVNINKPDCSEYVYFYSNGAIGIDFPGVGRITKVFDKFQNLIAIYRPWPAKENADGLSALHQSIEELNKGRSVEVDIPNSAEKLKVDVRPILQPDQDKEIEIKLESQQGAPVLMLDAKRKMRRIPSAPFLDGYFAPLHFKNPYDVNLQGFSYRQYEGGKDLQDKVLGHINDSVEVFQGMTAKQVRDRFLEIKNQAFGVPE